LTMLKGVFPGYKNTDKLGPGLVWQTSLSLEI
jgi:hypothetical protein